MKATHNPQLWRTEFSGGQGIWRDMMEEEEPTYGLRIHLEYEYLTDSDISWIFGFCRGAMRESLAEVISSDRRMLKGFDRRVRRGFAVDIGWEMLRGVRLPLDVYSVRTERSIEIVVTSLATAAITGLVAKFGEDIYLALKEIAKGAYKKLKWRPPRHRRSNLGEGRIDLVQLRRRSSRRTTILDVDDTGSPIRRRIVEEELEVVETFKLR